MVERKKIYRKTKTCPLLSNNIYYSKFQKRMLENALVILSEGP